VRRGDRREKERRAGPSADHGLEINTGKLPRPMGMRGSGRRKSEVLKKKTTRSR